MHSHLLSRTISSQAFAFSDEPLAGSKPDLKPGLKVFVAGAPKLPDGSLDVANIQVEKEIPPPQ